MSRENILHRVRTALGRNTGEGPAEVPPVRLKIPEVSLEARMTSMEARLEALGGRFHWVAPPAEARAVVEQAVDGRTAVASESAYLAECGIAALRGVRSGIRDRQELRDACASADVGITSADYALADTGTLVLLSRPGEPRLISLLPPAHIAVLPCSRLLSGLDELFSILPDPAAAASSMVLVTGPSRTADIEQILVRGVHGPGKITAVLVG